MKFLFPLLLSCVFDAFGADPQNPDSRVQTLPKAFIDGTGEGWRALREGDFTPVNCPAETFTWKDGVLVCTGKPTGVLRTVNPLTHFELVVEWRHLKAGGNSGIFVWTTPESIQRLADAGKPGLPHGIEVQVLDHGYTEQYEKAYKKPADWFTTNGDVFPVGAVRMTPFAPVAPDGKRSFPRMNRSKGVNEWNHYYVRAINGEVRLWVNGEEVSGGTKIQPSTGYLSLESEGAPVEFRNLRLRELP